MVEVAAEDGEWQLDRRDPRGVMRYLLWGDGFNFFFKGRRLAKNTDIGNECNASVIMFGGGDDYPETETPNYTGGDAPIGGPTGGTYMGNLN
jgi:hypothetical protein